jgi:hypothetical protein
MLLHYVWVVRADVSFEEASVEASRRMAEKVAAIRAGNWRNPASNSRNGGHLCVKIHRRARGCDFVEKLISAGQAFTLRLWIILVATAGGTSIGLALTFGKSGWIAALGMISAMLVLWSIIFGPTFLRQDFRQDLSSADILKSYPLPGWQIALGELLAPA